MEEMKHNSKEVILKFDLPGFKQKDVKVDLSEDSVLVRAENKIDKKVAPTDRSDSSQKGVPSNTLKGTSEGKKKDFCYEESTSKSVVYSTTLPKINPKLAKINFKGGVLKITAPKIKL